MTMQKPPRERMFDAAYEDNIHEFRAALAAGANLNDRNELGLAPIHIATKLRSNQVFNELLERKADLDAAAANGVRALHTAAFSGDVPKVRALVEHGANTKARNQQGRTPLDLAQGPAHAYLLSVHEQRALEANTAKIELPNINDPAVLDQVAAQQQQPAKRRGMRL